jgi:hypothetical protein
MIRFFVGSSNTYRHYNHADFSEYLEFKMVNNTSSKVFAPALDSIRERKGLVVVSVVKNLFSDNVKEIANPKALNAALESMIKSYLAMVKVAAKKRP